MLTTLPKKTGLESRREKVEKKNIYKYHHRSLKLHTAELKIDYNIMTFSHSKLLFQSNTFHILKSKAIKMLSRQKFATLLDPPLMTLFMKFSYLLYKITIKTSLTHLKLAVYINFIKTLLTQTIKLNQPTKP